MKEILQLDQHQVVTLVGAGGKSTTMYYLAQQMTHSGQRVLVTTTTKIYFQASDEGRFVEGETWTEWYQRLQDHQRPGDFLVAGVGKANGKIHGVEPGWIDHLAETGLFDLILVEGDGAACKSLKAPAKHEPVVPAVTTLLLPIMGMRVMGKPFSGEIVHRPELFRAVTGIREGEEIRVEHYAQIFCHSAGYNLPGHQPSRKVIPIINQVDNFRCEALAEKLAQRFLQEGMEMVILTSHRYTNPVRRVCR